MNSILFVLGIALFFGLVVVHEFGHFIMARRGGVEVEEFGIGFPPRLFKKRMKGGWRFTINLLPLGGFVKLKGEHDTDTEPGSLGAASVGTKASIMAAGVVMNLLAAYILLVILAVVGMPQLVPDQFSVTRDATFVEHAQAYVAAGTVEAGSPAAQAGLKADDEIVGFGAPGHAQAITDGDTLPQLTRQLAGQTAELQYISGGTLVKKTVTLRNAAEVAHAAAAGKHVGYLGASVYQGQHGMDIVRSTWSAPIVAGGVAVQYTALTLQGLGKAIAGVGSIIAGQLTGYSAARQAG